MLMILQQALSVKTREPRPTETLGIDYIKYKKFNFLWETQILPTIQYPPFYRTK
jgi:guanylate kinase